MVASVVVIPLVLAVLYVAAARRRARQLGNEFSTHRAVLTVVVAGVAGAAAGTLTLLALNSLPA